MMMRMEVLNGRAGMLRCVGIMFFSFPVSVTHDQVSLCIYVGYTEYIYL